jgi:hypothetical protein
VKRGFALGIFIAGCSPAAERPSSLSADLPVGVVARVGELDIGEQAVRDIGHAQGVVPRAALDRAVADALFALEAANHLGKGVVDVTARSAHARAVLETLAAQARAAGPARDEEIQQLTAERWTELDRPAMARTTHVVVLVKKPEDDVPARALAERLARVLTGSTDSGEFEKRAKAEPSQGLEVRVERLPAVAADGRTYYPERGAQASDSGTFDKDFSQAAVALLSPGDQSPVVKSAFGYHVILLVERFPEHRVPLEERRVILGPDVLARRAQIELKSLVSELKRRATIEVSRAADDLTSRVPVAR